MTERGEMTNEDEAKIILESLKKATLNPEVAATAAIAYALLAVADQVLNLAAEVELSRGRN